MAGKLLDYLDTYIRVDFRSDYCPGYIKIIFHISLGTTAAKHCENDPQKNGTAMDAVQEVSLPCSTSGVLSSFFSSLVSWLEAITCNVDECAFSWDSEGPDGDLRWFRGLEGQGLLIMTWTGSHDSADFEHKILLNKAQMVRALYQSFREFVESDRYDPIAYERLQYGEVFDLVVTDGREALAQELAARDSYGAFALIQTIDDFAHDFKKGFPRRATLAELTKLAQSWWESPSGNVAWCQSDKEYLLSAAWDNWSQVQRLQHVQEDLCLYGGLGRYGENLRTLRSPLIENWLQVQDAGAANGLAADRSGGCHEACANEPHGIDMQALLQALPISRLEPQTVALLTGLTDIQGQYAWQDSVSLLEPPAGQRVPYIDPTDVLEKLLRRQERTLQESQAQAIAAVARMKQEIAQERWVNFLDACKPDSPDCLPVPDLVAWLRGDADVSGQVAPDVVDFLEQAADVARRTPMFRGSDNWEELLSMEQMPTLSTTKAMIEFVSGLPWADLVEDGEWIDDANGYYMLYKPYLAWREAIRPVAMALEQALGEPVYYFNDLGDAMDDYVHSFLALRWCCTYKPQSPFVRYLLEISKARDVEHLKAALVDPASYTHPFKMNSAFFGMETNSCRMEYLPPDRHKTVGFVFLTEKARDVAQALLPQHIGAHLIIVAPKELLAHAWLAQATRTCRSLVIQYVHNGKINDPIGLLASVDALCVIANEQMPITGSDLKLAEAVEDLLWQSLHLGLETHFYDVTYGQLVSPESRLLQRSVPERVAERQAQRVAFTRQLTALRLSSDYGSSGLWDNKGRNLHYDLLDLPFPLVRRIAAWQRDYDDTATSPDKRSVAWWSCHDQEKLALAREVQTAVGANTAVSLYRREGWVNVSEIPHAAGDTP